MNSLKIFAANVANLSDARYFSAWEVDFMSFDLEPYSEEKWQKAIAMAEWIEGPIIALPETEAIHSNEKDSILPIFNWKEIQNNFPLGSFVCTIPLSLILNIDHNTLPISGHYIVPLPPPKDTETKEALITLCNLFTIFIDSDIPAEEIKDLIETFHPAGLLVRGGQEEKPGFKSFDDLDEWFEAVAPFR